MQDDFLSPKLHTIDSSNPVRAPKPKVQNGLVMVRNNKVVMHKFGFGMIEM